MGIRKERMADEVRDLLARSFSGGQMQDPRVQGVTVTAVKLSPDLQIASVYFRILGKDGNPELIKDTVSGLESAAGFLRNKLAKHLDVRRAPTLRFFFDESVERGSRIEELLATIK